MSQSLFVTEKMKPIKLFITDVDGVLTNGQIILGSQGLETKAFHAQDGLGIHLAKKAGIKIAIITGRFSEAVQKRAAELDLDYLYQGVGDKREIFHQLLAKTGLQKEETAYIGDDLNDLPIFMETGLKIAVANAVEEVKAEADYVTEKEGGMGAVREALTCILKAQDRWEKIVNAYLQRPEGVQ